MRSAREDVPAAVADVLRQGMARAPDARFESGQSFARALERAARSSRRPVRVARHRLAMLAGLVVLAAAGGAIGGYLAASSTKAARTVVRTVRVADSHALGDAAYAQLQVKNYTGALAYARRAYAALPATRANDPYRGYVAYDLGLALVRLGRCSEGLPYLVRASRLEPHEQKVKAALALARSCS